MKKLFTLIMLLSSLILTGCNTFTSSDFSYENSSSIISSSSEQSSSSEESSSSSCSSFSSQESSSEHVHYYREEIIEPSCLEQGYTIHTCDCGDSYIDSYVDALGHDYVLNTQVNATYESNGYIEYKCSRCEDSYREVIDKLNHSYSNEWSFNNDFHYHPCLDEGYEDLHIDEVAHSYEISEDEFCVTHTCSICGYHYEDYRIMPNDTYELVTSNKSLYDGVEVIFNNDSSAKYTIQIVENNKLTYTCKIYNESNQCLSVDDKGNLTLDDDNNIWTISILGTTNRLYTHIKNTNGDGQVIYLIYDESTHSLTTSIEKNNQFEVYRKVETIYPQDIEIRCNEEVSLGKKLKLDISYVPSNVNVFNNIVWSSSDESIIQIEGEDIRAIGIGKATITAKLVTADTNYRAKYLSKSFNVEVVEQAKDTWTIMIYMCGADLESDSGLATMDIQEILSVENQPEGVNIIIETGGAKKWQRYNIDANYLSHYHVEDKQLVLDEKITKASMGKQSTFEDFLRWGLEKYPAQNTGVVFWNHGGALSGCCYDENFGNDSLLNSETSKAFENVFNEFSIDKLDFVGYDCCLMQVQDVAEFNSHYFDYMIASQEAESGYGWAYDTWIDNVYEDDDIETILKANCDGSLQEWGLSSDQTLSYLDLSKMENYHDKFESLCSSIYTTVKSNYNSFKSLLGSVKSYGGYYSWYYYVSGLESYGCIDGLDFLTKLGNNSNYTSFSTQISEVKDAYKELVKYSRVGTDAGNSNGLSLVAGVYVTINASETNFTNWRNLF